MTGLACTLSVTFDAKIFQKGRDSYEKAIFQVSRNGIGFGILLYYGLDRGICRCATRRAEI